MPADVRPEPFGQHAAVHGAIGNAENEVDDGAVVRVQPIAATSEQQFDQVEPGSLVAVDKTVIAHNSVKEGRGLFMDPTVIPMVGTRQCGPDGVLVQDAGATAVLEGFVVLVKSVDPGDAVMPSDSRARAWPRDGRPRSPE